MMTNSIADSLLDFMKELNSRDTGPRVAAILMVDIDEYDRYRKKTPLERHSEPTFIATHLAFYSI